MSQDNQKSLVAWLSTNKLNFMKDALLEEDFTLDMIVDMTDDDITGIFDELKIPNLKRPRFRNAVKMLKQSQSQSQSQSQRERKSLENKNKESKIIDKAYTVEETLESLLSVDDSQRLTNPYVIICAIEDYSQSKPNGMWFNLPGVAVDAKNMIQLWKNTYNYSNLSLTFKKQSSAHEEKTQDQGINVFDNLNNNKDAMSNGETFGDFLVDIRAKIDVNKCNDGLIFYYSGHGVKNNVILSNGKKYKIKNIIEIFNGKNCVYLRNKPKIMIFDCCRGYDISETYEIRSNNNKLKGPNNPHNAWINNKYHINSGLATIFSNFEDFSISDSDTHGGCLTRSICKVFSHPSKISNYSLRELIIAIRRQTKINSGFGNKEYGVPNELVDFHETLEYKVYFDKYRSVKRTNKKATKKQERERHEPQSESKHEDNTNAHVAKIVPSKRNNIRWRFDVYYDYLSRGSDIHGIDNGGRGITCNDKYSCNCFSSISDIGMDPNTGIYTIRLKIDEISNDHFGNMIGITSEYYENYNFFDDKNEYIWYDSSTNWIGWSARDKKDNNKLPNGLYCGVGSNGRASNIFYRNKFEYKSRNGNYLQRLPVFKSGDIIVLKYNSDVGELSFELFKKNLKSNNDDNINNNEKVSTLDSYICNVPRDLTFYWFFGHSDEPMSITILD